MNKTPAYLLYPWAPVFVCLALGIIGARFYPAPLFVSGASAGILLILSFCWHTRRGTLFFMGLTFMATGYFMTAACYAPGPRDVTKMARFYWGKQTRLRGVFVSDVLYKKYARLPKQTGILRLEQIEAPWGWQDVSGKILVELFRKADVRYGDEVEVNGTLHHPFSERGDRHFSYRQYLANRGIFYILSVKKTSRAAVLKRGEGLRFLEAAYSLRHMLSEKLFQYLSRREAGVMSAVLLGDRSNLPPDIRALFVRTGTAHVLAISGLHIGILTALLLLLLRLLPLPRAYQYILLVVFLCGYMFLTGLRPSVARATVMAVIFILGLLWERTPLGINSLCFAGCLLLAVEPLLLFDIGFQLSFTCVLFILLGSRAFPVSFKKPVWGWLHNAFRISLYAWLGSLGFIMYYFGLVTPVSLLVNVLVIPVLSIVLGLGTGFFMTAFWWPAVAYNMALCLKLALNLMVALIFLFDQCPGSYFLVKNITYWYVIVYYIIIGLIFVFGIRSRAIDKHTQLC